MTAPLYVEALRAAALIVAGDASVPASFTGTGSGSTPGGGGRFTPDDMSRRTTKVADGLLEWLRSQQEADRAAHPPVPTGFLSDGPDTVVYK